MMKVLWASLVVSVVQGLVILGGSCCHESCLLLVVVKSLQFEIEILVVVIEVQSLLCKLRLYGFQ